jgi:hypothetical protein
VPGKTVATGYVELRVDDSKLGPSVREKATKVSREFGSRLDRELSRLGIEPIDIKASPRDALAAADQVERKLRELSGNAATVEVKLQAEKALGQLGRFRKQLGDVSDDAAPPAARGFFARFSARLGPLMANLPIAGPVAAAAAAAGIGAAPVLISALASGISAGAGAGILGAGLAVVAKDPKVKDAGEKVGQNFLAAMQEQAGNAFQGPALQALRIVDASGQRTAKRLGDAFRELSTEVVPFTAQMTAAAEILTGALASSAGKSGDALQGLGSTVILLSDATGDFITTVADGGPEAAANLQLVAGALGDMIRYSGLLLDTANQLSNNPWLTGALIPLLRKHYAEAAAESKKQAEEEARKAKAIDMSSAALDRSFVTQERVTELQKQATESQKQLNETIAAFAPQGGNAAKTADALKNAYTSLYSAQITAMDANEAYQASWDQLSSSIKSNKSSLDIHTEAGRANRDALQGLLTKNNELYFANISAGQSVDSARKKHEDRTRAIREEAKRLNLNKDATRQLIDTYGQIPNKKTTDLVVDGMHEVIRQLKGLYLSQRALAEGKTVDQVRYEGTAAMRSLLAAGGPVTGPGTATSDSVPAMLSNGEYVVKASSAQALGVAALDHINRHGQLPRYAKGGLVAPVDTSRRWPFNVDVSDTFIMSKDAALAKVTPAAPTGGSPTDGFMERMLEKMFGVQMISGYRPGARTLSGSLSWHGKHRAVDFPPLKAMAAYMDRTYGARMMEIITPYQEYNRLHGKRHTYTGAVWNQHNFAGGNAHNHFAMDDGGFRTLMPGWNQIFNGTGRPEPIAGPAAMNAIGGGDVHVHLHNSVIASKKAAEDLVVEAFTSARRARRLS